MEQMTNPSPIKLNCPTCAKSILWNDDFPFRPFCSDRCRLIDLGEWASESHRIPGESIQKTQADEQEDY